MWVITVDLCLPGICLRRKFQVHVRKQDATSWKKKPLHTVASDCEKVEKRCFQTIIGALVLMLELRPLATWERETKPIKVGTTGPVFFIAEVEKFEKKNLKIFCRFGFHKRGTCSWLACSSALLRPMNYVAVACDSENSHADHHSQPRTQPISTLLPGQHFVSCPCACQPCF